ncbi:MAG: cytochrome c oxidase subunit II [Solirubrobacteraceae bacterium]
MRRPDRTQRPSRCARPRLLRSALAARLAAPVALGVLVACAVLVPVASARALLPQPGASPNQSHTDSLYTVALIMGFVVFLAVEIGLIVALARFRARKDQVAAQIRGNTRLETAWTAGAVVLVTVLTVLVFIQLSVIKNPARSGPAGLALAGDAEFAALNQPAPPGGNALRIHVNGQQFVWRYDYPNGASSFETMYVPVNTTVLLDLEASDVAHQWWIPKLGGAIDAIPGYTNHTWFKISKPGVYYGQCALLCGQGHANMVAHVCAVPVDQYQTWVDTQKAAITQANKDVSDERALQTRQGGSAAAPPTAHELQLQLAEPVGPSYIPPGCNVTTAP